MICTPGSLAQDGGAGLGAQAGPATMAAILDDAGFARVRVAAGDPVQHGAGGPAMSARVGTVVVGAGRPASRRATIWPPPGTTTSCSSAGGSARPGAPSAGTRSCSNTPNWMSGLDRRPDGFGTARRVIAWLEQPRGGPPRQEGAAVGGVWRRRGGGYLVATGDEVFEADNVVAASGAQRVPYLPSVRSRRDRAGTSSICTSPTTGGPATWPTARCSSVGSGQSGAQIALELRGAGRRVLLGDEHRPAHAAPLPRPRHHGVGARLRACSTSRPREIDDAARQMLPQILAPAAAR